MYLHLFSSEPIFSIIAEIKLQHDHLERIWAWGRASSSVAHVYRPSTAEGVRAVFDLARENGRSIGFRGGGKSYGDAFGNQEQVVLDLSRFNRVLDWQPESGVIRVEPGLTVTQLWQYVLEDGWWPPIVTGTAKTTIGGCASMNTHGKNAWKLGTFGEHVLAFELLLPSGEVMSCSPENNADLFYAAIGGAGLLGCFLSLTLQMKRVYSGLVRVEAATRPNLASSMQYIEDRMDSADYLVGWLDAFARGKSLGRGEMHRADYLVEGEDAYPAQTMQAVNQVLGDSVFGILPKSSLWFYMQFFMNNAGTRLVNGAKYVVSRVTAGEKGKQYLQPHAAYHFLLDYVPNWKWAYGRGGLIQYQCFLPKETAEEGFRDIFELGQRKRLPNYLSVLKRHKPDPFLLSYGVDGFSMALDYQITKRNRTRVVALVREMDEIVLRHGGRFYFAKDSTLRPEVAQAYLGKEALESFFTLKRRVDPDCLLQTDLWRRVFGPLY